METLRIIRNLRFFPGIRQVAVHSGRASGFTLLEMLTVLIIFGVLTSIALPAFRQWRAHSAGNDAANTLMAHLKQARMIAVAENRSVRITFSGSAYIFDADTGSCGTCKKQQINYSQFSNNLSVSPTTTRTFSSSGTVNSGTITIKAADYSQKISLNVIGRAYLQ